MSYNRDLDQDVADAWLRQVTMRSDLVKGQLREKYDNQQVVLINPGSKNLCNLASNQEVPAGEMAEGNQSQENAAITENETSASFQKESAALRESAIQPEGDDPIDKNVEVLHEEENEEPEGEDADEIFEIDSEAEESEEEYEGDEEEEADEDEEERQEEEEEDAGTDGKTEYVDNDDFEAPKKKDSLEEMFEKEMEALAEAAAEPITDLVEEKEPEETKEDIIRDLKVEMEEIVEDRNQVELMIDFYEHRLAHGCSIKKIATKIAAPNGKAKGAGSPMLTAFLQDSGEGADILQSRFKQLLKHLDKTKKDIAESSVRFNIEINDEIQSTKSFAKEVDDEIKEFNLHRRRVAESAVFVENNRAIEMKEIERHEQEEEVKRREISKLRLRNVYLRNALIEKEAEVKTGVNYEEMEQQLLQNQMLQNRVEQKTLNNERVKGNLMRRVACITHVRQKADMLMDDVSDFSIECHSLDHAIQRLKEDLTHLRKMKDHYRKRLEVQRRDNGILGQESLLRNMEDQFDEELEQERLLKVLVERTNAFNDETSQLQDMIKALESRDSQGDLE